MNDFQPQQSLSENSEDIFLLGLARTVGLENFGFIEFGALDGVSSSNCALLALSGVAGIFLEPDSTRYARLCANYPREAFPAVKLRRQAVGTPSHNAKTLNSIRGNRNSFDVITIDEVIMELQREKNFVAVSIDIDGDDLSVLEHMIQLPSVVIIEYNPTIPLDVEYKNPLGQSHGSSASAIHRVASSKGYRLVKITRTNLIYLQANFLNSIPEITLSQDELNYPVWTPTRFFFGMDGALIAGSRKNGFSARSYFRQPWTSRLVYVKRGDFFKSDRAQILVFLLSLARSLLKLGVLGIGPVRLLLSLGREQLARRKQKQQDSAIFKSYVSKILSEQRK